MYTNRPPCGAMRGHGVPQPRFAFESLLDMTWPSRSALIRSTSALANAMDPNTRTVNDLDVLSLRVQGDARRRCASDRAGTPSTASCLSAERDRRRLRRLRVRSRLPHLPELQVPARQRDHPGARGRRGRDPVHRRGRDRPGLGDRYSSQIATRDPRSRLCAT